MIVADRKFGQLDAASTSAAVASAADQGSSLFAFYLVAVAAGVTVWFVTRRLSKGS